jgi:hypothetical protein
VVSACSICLSNYETSEHLFFHWFFCITALELAHGFLLNHALDTSSVTHLLVNIPTRWSADLISLARIAFIHVFHTIWMGQNGIRFYNSSIALSAAKTKIISFISTSALRLDGFSDSLVERQILSFLQVTPMF